MEQNKLCDTIRQIAWAYIFIHVHFNLGAWDLLADWLGYLWIFQALPVLGEEVASAKLLRPLGCVLIVWHGISWILTGLGGSITEVLGYLGPIAEMFLAVISIYFHFQLLTNLADLAAKYACPTETMLLKLRTIRTVISTLFFLQIPWNQSEVMYWIFMAIAVVQLIVAFWTCKVLFDLRKELWGKLQGSMDGTRTP